MKQLSFTSFILLTLTTFLLLLLIITTLVNHSASEPIVIAPNRPLEEVCFAALGDTGTGDSNQRKVSAALQDFYSRTPFDFVLLLGDQFYGNGVASVDDPQWDYKFETMYEPLKLPIRFYLVLGNHEYKGEISAFIERSAVSERWSPGGRFYSFVYSLSQGDSIQFFGIDSYALTNWWRRLDGQLNWLEEQLSKSKAKWKIVFGHYPIITDGMHKNSKLTERTMKYLTPLLHRYKVQPYMSGHDHNLQLLDAGGDLYQVISGGGGGQLYPVSPSEKSLFSASQFGFAVVCPTSSELNLRFVSDKQKLLYSKRFFLIPMTIKLVTVDSFRFRNDDQRALEAICSVLETYDSDLYS